MQQRMGQTAEDVRDNIVKIADENGNCVGTGFFIHKEYCVTCHHNICRLDEIYVEREYYNNETGQKKKPYPTEWVEEFSDMRKDIAFLKVKGADFRPLEYRRETYSTISVVVRGFPLQDLYNFPDGKVERGTLADTLDRFRWREEVVGEKGEGKTKRWNTKPEVNVQVYAFNGKFSVGFSGAPVCYENDWKVVGIFEAMDTSQGYIIPIEEIIKKFDLEGSRVSGSSSTLEAGTVINKGNEYYYKHEYQKAIEQYDIILNDPNYANASNNKAAILSKLGRHEEALPYYDKALEINPNHVDALNNKGGTLSKLGRHEEALPYYDKALRIEPNDATWYNKGSTLYDLDKRKETIDRHEEAIACYDKALEINPNHIDALNKKGAALYDLGRHEEAIACYDKALEINPNHAYSLFNRACSKVKKANIEGGLADLKKAIEIDRKCIEYAKQEKAFESIQNDKQFKDLIK